MKSSVSSPKPPNFAIRKKIPSYTTAKSQRKIITVCCWSSAARRKIGPSLYDTMITLPNRWWVTWVKQIVNPRKPITGLHAQLPARTSIIISDNAVLTTVKHNVDKTWLDDEIMGGNTRTRAYVRRDGRTTPKHNASGPVCCPGEGIKTTVRSSR